MASRRVPNEFHEDMSAAIHDLCQPLTTLRCRLELAMMQAGPTEPSLEEWREAVEGGLHDVRRAFESVEAMRHLLITEMKLRPSKL